MKIQKLKVMKINKYYLVVKDAKDEIGSIYISDVANYYIDDISSLFKIGDFVYGVECGEYKGQKSYSLKEGHNQNKIKCETGGGFLVLKDFINKFERN